MANKLGNNAQHALPLVGTEVWAALNHSCRQVALFLAKPERGLISLKVGYRGQHDFLAVAKRYADDGTIQVCFGSGPDFVGALLGLENSIDHDKWRPDKFSQ